jgi:hypothetical protein
MNLKNTFKSNTINSSVLLLFLTILVQAGNPLSAQETRDQAILSAESMYSYRWNEVDWSRRFREVYLYNAQDQLTQTSHHISSSGIWYNDWRISLVYDSQGLLFERLYQNGAGSDWINQYRDQYTYDDSTRLIQATHQLVDGESWRNSERRLYVYDEENRLSEEVIQHRIGSNWLNDVRTLSRYNQTGLLDTSLIQSWGYDEGAWLPNLLQRFSYDSQGRQTQWYSQLWVIDHWRNQDKEIYSYNSIGQLADDIIQLWVGSSWINIVRTVHSYGSNTLIEVSTLQEWDYDETIWYDESRQLFTHNNDGNRLSSTLQVWEAQDSQWLNDWLYEWQYPTTSTVLDLVPGTFVLEQNYPNPFNPSTTISFALFEASKVTLKVFDIQGRELKTLEDALLSSGNYVLQWNGTDQTGKSLNTGVYFCRLQSGSESLTIKLVLLK